MNPSSFNNMSYDLPKSVEKYEPGGEYAIFNDYVNRSKFNYN